MYYYARSIEKNYRCIIPVFSPSHSSLFLYRYQRFSFSSFFSVDRRSIFISMAVCVKLGTPNKPKKDLSNCSLDLCISVQCFGSKRILRLRRIKVMLFSYSERQKLFCRVLDGHDIRSRLFLLLLLMRYQG